MGMENEKAPAQADLSSEHPKQDTPALTVVFQTWATPIVGIVMLLIGLLGGYYGGQLIPANKSPELGSPASTDPLPGVPPADEDQAARQQELFAILKENTRHFRGDPDAPVTIIEFSDFL